MQGNHYQKTHRPPFGRGPGSWSVGQGWREGTGHRASGRSCTGTGKGSCPASAVEKLGVLGGSHLCLEIGVFICRMRIHSVPPDSP